LRQIIDFECAGSRLVGTLDAADGTSGLLIVSGGNEIRSGAYAGQAAMAGHFARLGHPVFRFDRRGVGDSEGENGGFESSADDLATAVAAFRRHAPQVTRLVAFGNCDAATALALFHAGLGFDALILANPWVIDSKSDDDAPTQASAAAIRARYWARLKNPRSMLDLLGGRIDLKKLAGGLAKAAHRETPNALARRLAEALGECQTAVRILIAEQDSTALAFMAVWKTGNFDNVRNKATLARFKTASHSFADADAKQWLYARIAEQLA
jgi:exosortase A-associated hydrolase 1